MRDGAQIQLYANQQLLRTLSDAKYTGTRHVGLIVSAYDQAPIDARFDNFAIYPPYCGPFLAAGAQLDETPLIIAEEADRASYREGTRNREGR